MQTYYPQKIKVYGLALEGAQILGPLNPHEANQVEPRAPPIVIPCTTYDLTFTMKRCTKLQRASSSRNLIQNPCPMATNRRRNP